MCYVRRGGGKYCSVKCFAASQVGKPPTKGRTGMPHTEETKKKMRVSSVNSRSPEGLKRIGDAHRGEKNHNWKGGITKMRLKIWRLPEYKKWRSDVFNRDRFVCQWCSESGYVEVHHIKEFNVILTEFNIKSVDEAVLCDQLWDINNGVTLCKECHNTTKRGNQSKSRKKAYG